MIKSRRLRWAGPVARMEERRSAFKILTGKYTMRHLGRSRRSWANNVRLDIKEMVVYTRNWVDQTLDRDYRRALVNAGVQPPPLS